MTEIDLDKDEGNLITTRKLAKVLKLSTERIRQLEDEGYFQSKLKGRQKQYDFYPSVWMYLEYMKRHSTTAGMTLAEAQDDDARRLKAEADLKEAKAAIENLKKEEFEATMHRSEDVETIMEMLVMAFRAEALAIPGAVAVDVAEATTAQEASGIIKNAVNNMLNRLTDFKYDPAKFKKLVREREKWMNERIDEGADAGSGGEVKPCNNKGVRRTKGA